MEFSFCYSYGSCVTKIGYTSKFSKFWQEAIDNPILLIMADDDYK